MLGYPIFTDSPAACVREIVDWIRGDDGGTRWLACINPHSYATARTRPAFSRALRAADWLVPDGIGIILGSRLSDGEVRERVTGSDIFFGVNQGLQQFSGMSVFFLGSTEETLGSIRGRFERDYPKVRLAGTYSPPFKQSFSERDVEEMIQAVNVARPDVLWVGMTAPKQEEWIHRALPRLDVRFAGAVGAVFDFYTGRVKRSSPAFQRLGLEWLPRLLQEPGRLWRRTFISAPVFLRDVLRDGLTGRTWPSNGR